MNCIHVNKNRDMLILGIATTILSIIEFGVGGYIATIFNVTGVGGWWAGLFPLFVGIHLIADFRDDRIKLVIGLFSLFGFVCSSISSTIDSHIESVVASLTGCINTVNGDTYGSDVGIYLATTCYPYNSTFVENRPLCGCANDIHACYGFNLATTNDCGLLLTGMAKPLTASYCISALLTGITGGYLGITIFRAYKQYRATRRFTTLNNDNLEDFPLYEINAINQGVNHSVYVHTEEHLNDYDNPMIHDGSVFVSDIPPVFIGNPREENGSVGSDSRHSPVQYGEDSHFMPLSNETLKYEPQIDYE